MLSHRFAVHCGPVRDLNCIVPIYDAPQRRWRRSPGTFAQVLVQGENVLCGLAVHPLRVVAPLPSFNYHRKRRHSHSLTIGECDAQRGQTHSCLPASAVVLNRKVQRSTPCPDLTGDRRHLHRSPLNVVVVIIK